MFSGALPLVVAGNGTKKVSIVISKSNWHCLLKSQCLLSKNRPLPKSWKQISSIFYWAKTVQHAISQLWKSVNPYCKRQNPKMKLWEVCPLSSTNHKTLKTTAFCRYLLYRHLSHNREFHNANWQILWCDSQCWLGMYKRPLTSHSQRKWKKNGADKYDFLREQWR